MAIDPKGKFAYVVNSRSNNVSVYSIDATTGADPQIKSRLTTPRHATGKGQPGGTIRRQGEGDLID